MDERWVLLDTATGLHVGWYFWLRVLDEANRAARYGIPFGLFLLEVDGTNGRQASDRTVQEAMALVPSVVRSTDLAGALGRGRVGVLLPHQDAAALEQASARIIGKLESSKLHGVRWHARMLSHPADAGEISQLLTSGWPEERTPRRRASERSA
jgi:PleD family two-component response regulator